MTIFRRRDTPLPGFRLTLGFTTLYMSLIVLIPLAALVVKSFELTAGEWWNVVTTPRVLASYRLSLLTSLFAALTNMVFGLLLAWVLVRYRFPGKKIADGLIDLPFALPTAVAGIALTTIYAPNGWIGARWMPRGIKLLSRRSASRLRLFSSDLPFVVRTVQPVMQDLEKDMEEAAAMLGAYRWRTFRRIILPELLPPLLTGFALAFARGIGEYGSVVFISGNMPIRRRSRRC